MSDEPDEKTTPPMTPTQSMRQPSRRAQQLRAPRTLPPE
jgi:hypothetical protein